MRIEIIGIGSLGSELAYTFALLTNHQLMLTEPHEPNYDRAVAEYLDLLPVAKHRRVDLAITPKVTPFSDIYIITSGERRRNLLMPKAALIWHNYDIVERIAKKIPKGKKVFVATNPPKEICRRLGTGAIPLRECTDYIRAQAGSKEKINKLVLENKGYTSFTPAYAMALRVLFDMDNYPRRSTDE